MAAATITTEAGAKVRVRSSRRYVLIAVDGKGRPYIERRSDSVATLRKAGRPGHIYDTITKARV